MNIRYPRKKLLKLAFGGEGLALAAALGLSALFRISLFCPPPHVARDILVGTGLALPPLALLVFFFSGRAGRIRFTASLKKTMVRFVKPIFSEARPCDLLSVSLMAGVSEELLFRGVVQTRIGLIPASILFGLAHFITPQYALTAAFMGLYIGAAFSLFQSILIPMQLHFIYDLGALFYLKYFLEGENAGGPRADL